MNHVSGLLIRVGDARIQGIETHELSRRQRAGSLYRLRRGVYVDSARWEALSAEGRQRLMLQVAVEAYGLRLPLCGPSSAFLHGLPLRSRPAHDDLFPVHLLNADATGGRSKNGIVHHRPDGRERGIVGICGLPCSDVINSAIDVAMEESFDWAVVVLDRLLNPSRLRGEPFLGTWDPEQRLQLASRRPVAVQQGWALPDDVDPHQVPESPMSARGSDAGAETAPTGCIRDRDRVAGTIAQVRNPGVRRRLTAALAFADPGGFLPGESLSRVLMHRFSLPQPELQCRFTDRRGLIGYTDFHWRRWRVVGEFDGKEKYLKAEYLNGRSPSEAVIAEKAREDRLRRLGLTVVRWTWNDLRNPDRLVSLLQDAGLPRSSRHHWTLSR